MEAGGINKRTLLRATGGVVTVEVITSLLASRESSHPILILGAARIVESLLILLVVHVGERNLTALGLARSMVPRGLARGITWSVGAGAAAALVGVVLAMAGFHPLTFIRAKVARGGSELLLVFLVGGLISPVAEELFFRGLLYSFLRRWGVPAAVLVSSLIFVLCHPGSHGLRLTQALGGILFAVAYEVERNLLVPITIHVLGNLAIFTLSLLS
ncbi:MAG TPA: CPBP family intramembrane glutamic endopeptidase [Syntrophobacteria bacterium]|nr:CPBP family intramembrane glutamic endopeptidase [Syntrophobacteria bacterium]